MKKLFSLFLFFTCMSFVSAQAQGIYVVGNVTDGNGNPVTNTMGYIESDCGTAFDSLVVDSQGNYNYFLTDTCTQGTFWVVFNCPNGNVSEAVGYYSPNTQTVQVNVVLDCGPVNPQDSCWVELNFIPSDPGPGNGFLMPYIDGGTAPYTYSWSDGSTSEFLNLDNYAQGTYTFCLTVTDANGDSCSACDVVTVGGGQNTDCNASFYAVDSFGLTVVDGYVSGGVAPYSFQWILNGNVISTQQSADLSNLADGTYYICFLATGADGSSCEYCEDVVVSNNQSDCYLGFEVYQDSSGITTLYAWNQGSSGPYTYDWWVGNQVLTGQTIDLANFAPGTYDVCVISVDANGNTCEYCDVITVGAQNNDCYTGFSLDGDYVYAWTQGGTAPYTYAWSDGSTGEVLDVTAYAPGTYSICLYVTDADGNTCESCDIIIITDGSVDECLDWDVIDLANAPCNFDYNPVCGCDGIEYTNACVAYYCFGILEWTDGPCGSDPTDTLCNVTAEFFYYGEQNANGGYDMFFFGFGENTGAYAWDMGDGTSYAGDFVEHTYGTNVQDSIQAYTVCLTTYNDLDSCSATVCETIVLDSTPNGFIGGEVVDGEQFVGNGNDGQVERVTNTEGDPLSEVTVELLDWNGAVIASTTTDEQGRYSFSGLQFGDYFVHVNIDGISHTPDHIKLSPVLQKVDNNGYEVLGGQVVSGINGVSFAAGINIAPNPTSGQLNIAMELNSNVDIRIVVTDILGEVVRQETNSYTQGNQIVELNLEELVSGIYLVSLQSNGEVYTTKVLKQ